MDLKNILSTIIGALLAVLMAWQYVDWTNFSLEKNWLPLTISGLIALGGYLTKIELPKKN